MSAVITVQAIYDTNMVLYPGGKTFCIPTDSQVMPTRDLPIAHSIPGTTTSVDLYPLLGVKTLEFGELWLNLTLDEYNELIRTAEIVPNNEKSITKPIVEEAISVTDSRLINVEVNAVFYNGTVVDMRTIVYVPSTGTIEFEFTLNDEDSVQILYHNI